MKIAYRAVIRPVARLFARIVVAPFCRLIEPFWKLRLTPLFTARFGHLALNNYLYVAQQRFGQEEKCSGRLFFGANPCNRQLFDMWRLHMPILESRILIALYMYCLDILHDLPMFRILPHDIGKRHIVNAHELVTKCGGVLEFTPQEHERGRALLGEMGLNDDDWFVCFQNRDPAYHEQRIGIDNGSERDTNIETFIEAAEMIADLGGCAIRMGAIVNAPLPEGLNPRIIDYATHHRSDFGDIYLLGNCRFFLGSPTGTAQVPVLFGVPVAMTNLIPLVPSLYGRNSLFIPKLLKDRKTGELVTFEAYLELIGSAALYNTTGRHWHNVEIFENDRFTLINNDSGEIVELCRDMFDQLDGKKPSKEACGLQDTFSRPLLEELPDVADYGPRIAPRFSVKYRDLF
jgi:putative glycosyltransferase (TIGR04372 family)